MDLEAKNLRSRGFTNVPRERINRVAKGEPHGMQDRCEFSYARCAIVEGRFFYHGGRDTLDKTTTPIVRRLSQSLMEEKGSQEIGGLKGKSNLGLGLSLRLIKEICPWYSNP